MQTNKFKLLGLTCGACEKVITKRLQTVSGVDKVDVSAQSGIAVVVASRIISQDEVTKVLEGTHYKVNKKLS